MGEMVDNPSAEIAITSTENGNMNTSAITQFQHYARGVGDEHTLNAIIVMIQWSAGVGSVGAAIELTGAGCDKCVRHK